MRRKIAMIAGAIALFVIGIIIGAAGKSGPAPAANPRPTVTVTATETGPTQTETVTASPPAPGPGTTLVTRSSANETWNSKPFNIGSGPVTVTYSYSSCPNGSGNFIADLITAGVSQSDTSYEDINIANLIGAGGSKTTQEYPQQPGTQYYLSIDTECTYSVSVKSSG